MKKERVWAIRIGDPRKHHVYYSGGLYARKKDAEAERKLCFTPRTCKVVELVEK